MIIDERYKKYELCSNILWNGMTSIFLMGMVISYFQTTLNAYKLMIASVFLSSLTIIVIRIFIRMERKVFIELICNLITKTEFSKETVHFNRMKIMNRIFSPSLISFGVLMLLITAIPLFVFFTKEPFDYNDPDIYFLPYLFHYWRISSGVEYIALQFLQILMGFPIMLFGYVQTMFICYTCANMEAHLVEMNLEFQKIISAHKAQLFISDKYRKNQRILGNCINPLSLLWKTETLWKKKADQRFIKDFNHLIRHHQYLRK